MGNKNTKGIEPASFKGNDQQRLRILCIGPLGAGKTEILMKLKIEFSEPERHDSGLIVSKGRIKRLDFISWDTRTADNDRGDIQEYIEHTKAVIYVIDATKSELFEEYIEDLLFFLKHQELEGVKILVFLNKMDLVEKAELVDSVKYFSKELSNSERVEIICSNALTGEGLSAGIEWLMNTIGSPH